MQQSITLPTFLVVGANKGGTTSIYHYLKQHPDIYLSPIKEPHYFSQDIDVQMFSKNFAQNKFTDIEKYVDGDMHQEHHASFLRDWEQYKKLFKNSNNKKAAGELSTSYLYSKTAAQFIFDKLGKIKIIICLRNPIERAFSHYRMNLWTGNNNEFDFETALKKDLDHRPKVWGNAHLYVEIGMYYEQVKRYIDVFGSDHVKIIFTEDLKQNTQKVISELYAFIGVDQEFIPDTSQKFNEVFTPKFKNMTWFLNKTGIRPIIKKISPNTWKNFFVKLLFKDKSDKGKMSDSAKLFLKTKYQEDIQKLEILLQKDLSDWLK